MPADSHGDGVRNEQQRAVLKGAQIPATKAKPTGLAMPAFENKLSDAEIADVLTYIRNSWGNHASAVSKGTVADLRNALNTGTN